MFLLLHTRITAFVLLLGGSMAYAQEKRCTLSGTVADKTSGETIIGALVRVPGQPAYAVSSNEYGFYSLTLPAGSYTITCTSMGFVTDTLHIDIQQDTRHDIFMREETETLDEVTVTATPNNSHITGAETGVEKMEIKELNKVPVLFGEKDLMKTIQLLPGIKSTGDGSSGISVRGGAVDQNLILLDEALVYNAAHLMGFFSTFNSDAVKDVAVYKGTQPAQYGGRLSSALDVRMKEGNRQQTEANGSIGLISSKLCLEGPVVKNKGAYLVSARRTYADLFLGLSSNDRIKNSQLYFYDLNAKINYQPGKKDVIFLSAYTGRDRLGLQDRFTMNWGNLTGTLRWNHIMGSKSFSNTSLIVSDYLHTTDVVNGGSNFNIRSHIRDYTLKQEFQYFSGKHALRYGLSGTFHNITPGRVQPTDGSPLTGFEWQDRYSIENAVYISDQWKALPWLNLNAGFRLSHFAPLGRGDFYTLNNAREITDTVSYAQGQTVKNFLVPEPRLTASFIINESRSVKLAYTRNAQYLHLVSNNTPGSPTDKWIPSNNNIPPEISDLVSLGYFMQLKNGLYELGTETYFKYMQNQPDYKDGANIVSNDAIETQLLTGIGRAYGIEFSFRKKTGAFTGWLSYTLSRSEKKIDGINSNQWYVARQDRTHDVALVLMYGFKNGIDIAATWVYSTGNAITYPSGKYYADQQVVWLYTERNGYRMPAYHRLDLSVTFPLKAHKHFTNELSLGLYNAYGRQNAYMIEFRENPDQPGTTEAVQTALFRFVPSITWNFKIK